ncbi:MAG TPA: prolyl oligopeptidase family serine peptidase, partial [Verrucomicrobiae bacterium]|nr:prolyl oligopeptidase family serine peptidase [Verrucomicrobiae bacterium]
LTVLLLLLSVSGYAQEYGKPDREKPGDEMIQHYLSEEAIRLETNFLGTVQSAEDWRRELPRYRQEYFEMLGLWPLPEKTPLHASITHTIDRGDYQVDCLHYQSRPGLYVTANLYRPAQSAPGGRFPAVFYVCGHSGRGRNGNKTAFQSHGIWLARHGYICLMVDTLQLGEIAAIHHGTYREERWWWLSRGYTPAGVECWNGMRGIDYLASRPDVDPERIGVTGISGGGAATFWISAADERVKVAIPVSGMADLTSYLPNRVINGHCDCMFLYNTFQWPWTRIAGLIAPRPLLFVNSDHDPIFPMDANERVINRLERLYSLFGASDRVDAFVSMGGHDYRQDIRQASFRFLNTYLKNDPRPIEDSEVDLVSGPRETIHPMAPETLRAFPTDSDIPSDALNTRIDEEFVPVAHPASPSANELEPWRHELMGQMRRLSFHHFPERIPAATLVPSGKSETESILATEPNINVRLRRVQRGAQNDAQRVVLVVIDGNGINEESFADRSDIVYTLEPRGIGGSEWTKKNPPNFVERSHYLLGRTVDTGRVWDIAATARYLQALHPGRKVVVAGRAAGAVLGLYAALLEPDLKGVVARGALKSLMDPGAPAILNALRVCDVPDLIRMLGTDKLKTIE